MNLAPIALFVYNRPEHTARTLEALAANDLAKQSDLFVFCDGPKTNANAATLEAINRVRTLVKSKPWCKSITIHESDANKGLAASIVSGVTQLVNEFGCIIVLEDDIVTARGFLSYMNEALNLYEHEEQVMHIGSYIPYTNSMGNLPKTFFSRFMSCWGWATWKIAWSKANWDAETLYHQISDPNIRYEFNLEGVLNYHEQLENNINGNIKTWAIMWFTSVFLNLGLCLYPKVSLSENIGLDGSGENCVIGNSLPNFDAENAVKVEAIPLIESKKGKTYLKRFYTYGSDSTAGKRVQRHYINFRYQLIKRIKGL